MGLSVVRDLRDVRAAAGPDEIERFETDVFAGFVLARCAAGLSDNTIRSDVSHLEHRLNHPSHQRQRAHRAIPPPSRHPGSPPRRPSTRRSTTHGPDPLHLAVVFGLDETTAIRYATVARQLLQTPAEEHDPTGLSTNPRINSPQIH